MSMRYCGDRYNQIQSESDSFCFASLHTDVDALTRFFYTLTLEIEPNSGLFAVNDFFDSFDAALRAGGLKCRCLGRPVNHKIVAPCDCVKCFGCVAVGTFFKCLCLTVEY